MNNITKEIKEKLDILEVVGQYVPLKKRGQNYLALCPFHQEKTASFTVSQEKQLWHCFGCGQGGTIFDFVMKIEKIEFGEALEMLAGQAGLDFNRAELKNQQKKNSADQKLYKLLTEAAAFFQEFLMSGAGEPARKYLADRKISERTIRDFNLGLAPAEGSQLLVEFTRRGYSPASLLEAGLIIKRENSSSYYDRFRDRIIFPVMDVRGRALAFGGRIYKENQDPPKYLNSPETPVYIKGQHLYGLHLAKDKIKELDEVIVVEGYLDAISLHQAGFTNAIAALGTAFTLQQAKLLSRFTKNILVAFDLDAAGISASQKSIEILTELGLRPRVLTFAGFKDPDEFLKARGAEEFKIIKESAISWLEFSIKAIINKYDLNVIEEKSDAVKELVDFFSRIKDQVLQVEYAKKAAGLLGLESDLILSQVNQKKHAADTRSAGKNQMAVKNSFSLKPVTRRSEAEKILIRLALENAQYARTLLAETEGDFFMQPELKQLRELLAEKPESSDLLEFMAGRPDEAVLKNKITAILMEVDYIVEPERTFSDCLNLLKKEQANSFKKTLLAQIAAAEKSGDFQTAGNLKDKYCSQINSMLKGEQPK